MVRFSPEDGVFNMLDNGRCIAFDEDAETQELITDNYALMKKVSRSVEYQYILDMNHTVIRF